jgi:hypothetical protein
MLADEGRQHVDALGGVQVDHATPFSRSQSIPPAKLTDSPTTTVPMPNCRTRPLQYQQGESVVTMTLSR